ncbi:hypothetical protein BDN70DRAFT_880224 [Pholiota conissans]|uniref:C2H2-type domain-containing protein n=1 Tax=Pholiota conissans TaxID=109636 RepID=A0A9P5Z0X9_9AGAR|nr:hypothetical protein BDN70DRAFT_880224 [Pholiota conissans]
MATTSAKRPRAPSSPSSSLLASSSGSGDPPHKASRIIPSSSDFSDVLSTSTSSDGTVKGSSSSSPVVGSANANANNAKAPLLCNLPPTCHRQPTPIANTTELERHYAKYHAHVCEERGCGCVFPEARLLDLHQTECHDTLAQIRMERGEKIFQCHIPAPTCGRNFLTPKARRLHLIQAHSYPKEYFFAVTNKGIGGLLKRWGEGASMVRKEWKAREGAPAGNLDADMKRYREEESDRMDEDDEDDEEEETEEEEEEEEVNEEPNAPFVEEDDEEEKEDAIDLEATPRMLPARTVGITSPQSLISTPKQKHAHPHPHTTTTKGADANVDVAGLVHSLDSLSLVPDSIRFGRGGKASGFAHGRGGIGHASRGGRGRGGGGGALRGRGRGGEVVGATPYLGQNIAALASGPHGAENPALLARGVARGRARGSRGRVRGPGRGRGL